MEVVILCGGKGTRAYPFTEYFPKPMMPIGGTPILVHLMESYARRGWTRFVLAAGHRMEMLVDYFKGRFNDWHIDIVDTGADSDTGERIRRCAPYVGELFHATYGDGLGSVDLTSLVDYHKSHGGLATVTTVPLRSQYGTVVFDDTGRVTEFREKPIISDHWINAGFFVFSKQAFDHWDGQNLESEILPKLLAEKALYSFRHDGFWKSMDTSRDQSEFEKLLADGNAPWIIE